VAELRNDSGSDQQELLERQSADCASVGPIPQARARDLDLKAAQGLIVCLHQVTNLAWIAST